MFKRREIALNTSVTSKEAILETCRNLVSEKGLSSLNMRAVAEACEVALGSIYYYFPSKSDLLIAAIESVWEDIFKLKSREVPQMSFIEYIDKCFEHIQLGIRKYPNFFTIHSISFLAAGQNKAHASMERYLAQIREKMLHTLQNDNRMNKAIFSESFTEADFVDFVLSNIVCFLIQKKDNCEVLLKVIESTIY